MKLRSVEERVVVLVGASGGIGREAALRFADRCARAVVVARGRRALDRPVEEIRERGGEATAVIADASAPGRMRAVGHLPGRT